jgi:dihydrofolate reductase
MKRIIMWNLVTLDGFFEGPRSWDLAFHKHAWGEELEQLSIEQLRSADTLLFGRVTYEGMAAYWSRERGAVADLMNSIAKIVFSRTLGKADWNNTTLVKSHAAEEVEKLKRQAGKDVYIFGSAVLSTTLTRHRLIDEYRLALVPVLLGRGNPLFKESPRTMMKLLEARQLKNGCVIVRYELQGDGDQEVSSKPR